MKDSQILQSYEYARERYAALGVDTDKAIGILEKTPISLHCWQTDDVIGFERDTGLSGGIQTTGNYPGRARNIDEVRRDILFAKSLIRSSDSTRSVCDCVFLEDWSACKTKQMELFEALYNILMQFSKLRTMAFIKNQDNVTLENWMAFILFDEDSELLNCSNNNLTVIIFQLFFKDGHRLV